jgi:hypothetical protein
VAVPPGVKLLVNVAEAPLNASVPSVVPLTTSPALLAATAGAAIALNAKHAPAARPTVLCMRPARCVRFIDVSLFVRAFKPLRPGQFLLIRQHDQMLSATRCVGLTVGIGSVALRDEPLCESLPKAASESPVGITARARLP